MRIEDKNHNHVTFGGTPKFKDRWAVLCPTRLLMFKSEQSLYKGMALAVYPIVNSTFDYVREHGQPCVKLSFCEQALENESVMKHLGAPVIKTFWCDSE